MKDTIFREYDIRGKVGQDLLINQVYDLTRAIAYYVLQHNPRATTIAVGMDGRTHSPAIKDEVCRALIDSGLNVLFLGICPSPALYFALHTQSVDGGIMITASHNTKEFNGMKLCLGTESVWGKELQTIKQLYKDKKQVDTTKIGTIQDFPIIPHYVASLCDQFPSLQNMPLAVIVDCANGTAGTVLPLLVKKMNWNHVSLLYEDVDGTYPNHEADPTVEKNMQDVKAVLATTDTAFGIGLDGDCDRMAVMTKKGKLIPGDQLLAVFAKDVLKHNPRASIVFDIKSSSGLVELLDQWDAQPIMSPSGHSIIKTMMLKHNALLGGELSCHFFFKDRNFGYDDGIYAMMRLFEIVTQTKKPVAELIAIFPQKYSSREFRIPCPEEKKVGIVTKLKEYFSQQDNVSIITLDGVRASFPFGWGIVRASNTQAVLSMRFESNTLKGLQAVIDSFYTALTPYLSKEVLQELYQYKEHA